MTESLLEFDLKNPSHAARWEILLNSFPGSDVYHRSSYILASSAIEHSEPIGLVIRVADCQFLIPTLVRTVAGPSGELWNDAISPYGYGGVLCESFDVPPKVVAELFRRFRTWCAGRRLVCCVLRSHPLLGQHWLSNPAHGVDFVKVGRSAATVAVGLEDWDGNRRCPAHMQKGRRSDLALSRKSLRVTWNVPGDTRSAIEQFEIFQKLYDAAMLQLGADRFFLFPAAYYQRLSQLAENIAIAVALRDERPVGAAVFMAGRTHAHYHLSATDEVGRKYRAGTLLIVGGAEWARGRGCQALHLGGGRRRDDSLLHFKQSFGGSRYEYCYLTLIADYTRYQAMSEVEGRPWPYHREPECRTSLCPPQEAIVKTSIATSPWSPTVTQPAERGEA